MFGTGQIILVEIQYSRLGYFSYSVSINAGFRRLLKPQKSSDINKISEIIAQGRNDRKSDSNILQLLPILKFWFLSKLSIKPKLIESWGYKAEEHTVTTSDGYTLTLHRIPGKRGLDTDDQKRKIPVLLGHCLVGTSAIWAFGPVENSLAYLLADQGTYLSAIKIGKQWH